MGNEPNVGGPAWFVTTPGAIRVAARITRVNTSLPRRVDLKLEDGSGRTNVLYYEDSSPHVTPYCFKPEADDNVDLSKVPADGMGTLYAEDGQNTKDSE